MFRALLLAAPGAGKGTQGERLARRHGVPHLATGDLLRDHVRRDTAIGREAKAHMDVGDLVPDELVNTMVFEAIGGEQAMQSFLLDGFPRTLAQAEAAFSWARTRDRTFHVVIILEVPEDELVRRLVERGRTQGRSDDTEQVIRNRLEVYRANTAPLIDFYERRGILVRVDGTGDVETVTDRVETAIEQVVPDR